MFGNRSRRWEPEHVIEIIGGRRHVSAVEAGVQAPEAGCRRPGASGRDRPGWSGGGLPNGAAVSKESWTSPPSGRRPTNAPLVAGGEASAPNEGASVHGLGVVPPRSHIRRSIFDVPVIEEPMGERMSRGRVVLVEDHADSLEALSLLLSEKYAVFGYASATAAVQAIDAAKPDVLVLDVGMQPVDGVACLGMIRATPGYGDIPAVALTGYAGDLDRRRFLDRGFQAVVVKPVFDFGELTALIDMLANPAADLDGRAVMTASRADGSGKADGPGSA
jgi:CheY-like chemotaxis protein